MYWDDRQSGINNILECTKNTKENSLRQNFDEIDHMAKIIINELEVSI